MVVLLGVDVGTSMAKAALFDKHGAVIKVAARSVPLNHPRKGHVEQDIDAMVSDVAAVITEVLTGFTGGAPSLMAITGQGDGCWLTDAQGMAVTPGASWMDGRAAEILQEWTDNGTMAAIFVENGNAMFPGAPAAILAWFDRYHPEVLDSAATAGYVKDVMVQRFTGLRATDATDASLPFGRLDDSGLYSATVLELTGLQHRANLLAPIIRPLPVAPLHEAGSVQTGLPAGTPVVGACFDIPACAIGCGVREIGDGMLIIGTTLACTVLTDDVDLSASPAGLTITMPTEGHILRMMPSMVGTATLDWALNLLGADVSFVEEALATSPVGANGAEALPYLAPSGERAPFVDPLAQGQVTGLNLTTTRADFLRAICESLAYASRQCFEAAGLKGKVFVCGGGAGSRAWLQIFASVLGRRLYVARAPEVGARGAVLAAAAATGLELDVVAWTEPQGVVEPVPEEVQYYEFGYQRYLMQQENARKMWRK